MVRLAFFLSVALLSAFGVSRPAVAVEARPALAGAAAPVIPVAAEAEFVYDEHAQRDPFWPLVTAGGAIVTYDASVAVTEMVLEGVVVDGSGGIAIINGTVVEQGKQYGMYTVEKIDQDKVTLVNNGQVSELRIKKEE